jgi:hypothetical protein
MIPAITPAQQGEETRRNILRLAVGLVAVFIVARRTCEQCGDDFDPVTDRFGTMPLSE